MNNPYLCIILFIWLVGYYYIYNSMDFKIYLYNSIASCMNLPFIQKYPQLYKNILRLMWLMTWPILVSINIVVVEFQKMIIRFQIMREKRKD